MALTDFIGEGAAVREFNNHPDRATLRITSHPHVCLRTGSRRCGTGRCTSTIVSLILSTTSACPRRGTNCS
jgi:hypothetical protein